MSFGIREINATERIETFYRPTGTPGSLVKLATLVYREYIFTHRSIGRYVYN